MSEEPTSAQPTAPPVIQFGLRDLLGSLVTISMFWAYLRTYPPEEVYRGGIVLLVAAVLGAIAGAVSRNVAEGSFWAVIGAAWAYLAVVSAYVPVEMRLLWPLIGSVCGAATGTVVVRRPWLLVMLGALSAGTVFLVWTFMLFVFGAALNLIFDFCCAVLAGGGLGGVIYVSRWLEDRIKLPRFLLALLLMALAIAASWGGKRLLPGW